ncbi:MAG: hypothetical protein Q4G19_02065 [Clostridia bacterium]|nr:hypothetical protein [Clostridia bacterium]
MDKKAIKYKLKNSYILSTAFYFARQCIVEPLKARGKEPVIHRPQNALFQVKVAIICDEMTWQNCKDLFQEACYLTPGNWKKTLEQYKPDFLFCESAWTGIDEYWHIWCGRIFKNHKVLFENRKALLGILACCKKEGIPAVFWNKEDPVFYREPQSDFTETALLFDHIFTTARECVAGYEAEGHSSVHVMPFGFSPRMFHPLERGGEANGAVFAGSWFSEHKQRCKDMRSAFEWLKKREIALTIYDRQYGKNGVSSFPYEYRSDVRPAEAYADMGAIYRKYAIGVNINTVKESETMFARRVYEMIACGLPVVSNESLGIRERFGRGVAFVEDTDAEIASPEKAHDLLRDVFLHDTFEARIRVLLETIGISQHKLLPALDVFCIGEKACRTGEEIDWPRKRLIPVSSEAELKEAIAKASGQYGIVLDDDSVCPDIAFFLTQFAFLPADCGVCAGSEHYRIEKTSSCKDILWPLRTLKCNAPAGKYRYIC